MTLLFDLLIAADIQEPQSITRLFGLLSGDADMQLKVSFS
jgi:hypothetical protein